MKKHVFEAGLSLKNEEKHVLEAFSSYLQNKKVRFCIVFQVHNMETTFLNRFSVLKNEKARFSSLQNEKKQVFEAVLKFKKWKGTFLKRF